MIYIRDFAHERWLDKKYGFPQPEARYKQLFWWFLRGHLIGNDREIAKRIIFARKSKNIGKITYLPSSYKFENML